MKRSELQAIFTLHIARLVLHADSLGYALTYGEAYRPPYVAEYYARQGRGISDSLHGDRLAVDFNLFRNGLWLRDTEDHRELGEYWERQHSLARWGGRFNDGNHYSFADGDRA